MVYLALSLQTIEVLLLITKYVRVDANGDADCNLPSSVFWRILLRRDLKAYIFPCSCFSRSIPLCHSQRASLGFRKKKFSLCVCVSLSLSFISVRLRTQASWLGNRRKYSLLTMA